MILENYKEIVNNCEYSIMIVDKYKINDNNEKINLGFEGTVWAENGSTVILNSIFNNIENFNKDKKRVIKDWEKHIIQCSDCGKKCKYDDIKHNRYFAGIYCDKCWNNKWKAIEAEEDYN